MLKVGATCCKLVASQKGENMSKYINLGKQLVRLYRMNLTCEGVIKEFLLSAETIDVVRCKDCWKRNDEDFCPLVSDNCYPPTLPDDWFCKDGERRE